MVQKLKEIKDYEPYLDNKDYICELKRDGNYVEVEMLKDAKDIAHFTFYNRDGQVYTKDISKMVLDSFNKFNEDNYATSFRLAGELVYVDKEGKDHRTLAQSDKAIPYFMAFEILELNGEDLRGLKWKERKHELTQLFMIYDMQPQKGSKVIIIPHFSAKRELLQFAKDCGLEGIVLKHVDAVYGEGYSDFYIKIKFTMTDEYFVIGYVTAKEFSTNTKGETINNKRFPTFGALMLAKYKHEYMEYDPIDGSKFDIPIITKSILVPMGRVGGGFKDSDLEEVTPLLHKEQDYILNTTGLTDKDYRYAKGTINWISPEHYFVVEVLMSGLTEYGRPFQPRFISLREEKKPEDCVVKDEN